MDHLYAPPKVLVAPLDWGLGHATRCIPIIRKLEAAGTTVLLAGDGKIKSLLKKEFPQLRFLQLPGYGIRYAATSWGLPFKIVAQIPRLISIIKKEQQWLSKLVQEEELDAVVSDNRFGLHHPAIVSIFITHQLRIKTPFESMETLMQRLNYKYINRFTECWIPDAEKEENLAGGLSHPIKKPKTYLRYIGPLSRFSSTGNSEENHLLIILSGPEPQRTILENLLIGEMKTYKGPAVFIRGLPQATETISLAGNVSVHNHLPSAEMKEKIKRASFVISRCGYSTVMDLAVLKKKAILIPTPGQTEQEYLAAHLMKKNFALCVEQKKFRLKNALELAQSFSYNLQASKQSKLDIAILSLMKEINKRRNST